jgi:putative redox protein
MSVPKNGDSAMIESRTLDPKFQSEFSNGHHASIADLPSEKGGSGQGFGPHDLLEAALATCMSMTAHLHADKHGLPLRQARCTVRIDRSNPAQATLEYRLHLEGPLTPEQSAELRQAVAQCPVSRTLTHPIRIVAQA